MNYTIQNKNFDIRRTFLCGQCFRWSEDENGAFSGIAGGRSLTVTQSGDEVTMHGVSEQDIPFWENYFDLGTDYSAYIETLSADETLKKPANSRLVYAFCGRSRSKRSSALLSARTTIFRESPG